MTRRNSTEKQKDSATNKMDDKIKIDHGKPGCMGGRWMGLVQERVEACGGRRWTEMTQECVE
jgi:hypothetical protein